MKHKKKKRCEKRIILIENLALKELRQKLNLTLREASKLQGVSDKSIWAIENGLVNLDQKRVEEIVQKYGSNFEEFRELKKLLSQQGIKNKNKRPKNVLTNSDRRSYQRNITKECIALKALRKSKNISQDKASKLCGYARSAIGHIENGRIELSKERIEFIVESYGIAIKEFNYALNLETQKFEKIELCEELIKTLDERNLDMIIELVRGLKGNR